MINFHELRMGDIVMAEYEGQRSEGEVIGLNGDEKEVEIRSGDQEFWFSPGDLYAIPLDREQLMKFGFQEEAVGDGTVKYMYGPFRVLISEKGNFSHFEIWYREDRRHIAQPLMIHQLQNHYHQMTKVDLTRETPGVKA